MIQNTGKRLFSSRLAVPCRFKHCHPQINDQDPCTVLGSCTCNKARDAVVYATKKGSARATQLNRQYSTSRKARLLDCLPFRN